MTEQMIFSLLAASFGFISALFFGAGSAFTSTTRMVALSKTYWDFNKEFATATVTQSSQYAIGALLLIISFFLQVIATITTTSSLQLQCPIFATPWLFIPSALLTIGLPAYLLCSLLTEWRLKQVMHQLQKEITNFPEKLN